MKWIIFLLLLSGKMVNAQSNDALQYHSIKIDFVNFIDDFPALLFSFEHPIGKNLFLTHEGGPILPSFLDDRETSGFKLKEEIRLMVRRGQTTDMYLGFAVRYTQENLNSNVVYGFGCNSGRGCTYFQNFYGEFTKKLISFDPRVGLRHNFYPFYMEYDLGFGYGKDYIYSPEINAGIGSERVTDPFNTWVEGWKILFYVRANFGFRIFSKKSK